MSFSPIREIARREVRDTLTDWRILLPIFILTFVLPLLLISAANFAITFVGDPQTITTLIPFTMLLVGFIPASFSLITALESFVGERERNSLEALLAMPITDGQLYLGKLISAVTPPLLSSYVAMSVFALALLGRFPALFFQAFNARYLIVAFLLITAKAIVMVSAAVIISSHTTSIRAANLLASFVLIPTASIIQLEALLVIGHRWDVLELVVVLLIAVAAVLIRTGMGAFNREEILSREHEQLNLRRIGRVFTMFVREYQSPGVAPERYRGLRFSARRFYTVEFAALLRDYRLPIAMAALAALIGLLSGNYIGHHFRVRALDAQLANVGQLVPPSLVLVAQVVSNNLRVSIFSNLLSPFVFGAFAFLVPAVAFAQIGFVSGSLVERGGSWLALGAHSPLQFLLAYVLPHGIVELPIFILSAAMGIRVGASLMSPPKGFSVGQNMLWSLAQCCKVWLLVLLPGILLGGLIEGLISPRIVQALYGG